MRIVFIGTGEIGVPTLRALLNREHEVVAVVTQPDKPVGREQRIEPPPIKKAIAKRPECRFSNRRESKIHKPSRRFARLQPDVIVVDGLRPNLAA